MKKPKPKTEGFDALPYMLAICALAVVIFIGYLFYNAVSEIIKWIIGTNSFGVKTAIGIGIAIVVLFLAFVALQIILLYKKEKGLKTSNPQNKQEALPVINVREFGGLEAWWRSMRAKGELGPGTKLEVEKPTFPQSKKDDPPIIDLREVGGLEAWLKSEKAKGRLQPGTTFRVTVPGNPPKTFGPKTPKATSEAVRREPVADVGASTENVREGEFQGVLVKKKGFWNHLIKLSNLKKGWQMKKVIIFAIILITILVVGLGATQIDAVRFRYIKGPEGFVYKIDRINGDIFLITYSNVKKINPSQH